MFLRGKCVLLAAILSTVGHCSIAAGSSEGEPATLGILAYLSSWQHSPHRLRQEFEGRGLPPVNTNGIFVTGFGMRHGKGLQLRDIVFEISGKKIVSEKSLSQAMERLRPGVECEVKVKRYEVVRGRAKWHTVILRPTPFPLREFEAELAAWREAYQKQLFRFSSGLLLPKTGREIDEANTKTWQEVRELLDELSDRGNGLFPRGPKGESVTTGIDNVQRVVNILTHRDPDTVQQHKEANIEEAKLFVEDLYRNGQGADEEFAVSTVFGALIMTFDDGTAFFYQEMWDELTAGAVR